MNLNPKDRIIISMYAQDPEVSQDEIASELKISQPSVAARVRKLRDMDALTTQTGISPLGMGLVMAKVDVATNNTKAILDLFKGCPYFANGFTVSGSNNLCLLFVGENIATLEAIVNGHLRTHPSVSAVDFNILISSQKPFILPIVLTHEKSKTPPCGIRLQCRDCDMFREKKCNGCPATGQYQGWLY